MDAAPGHTQAAPSRDEWGAILEILAAIHEQGRQTHELVKALVGLITPKADQNGPTLEELLANLIAQQSQIITIGKTTQADLDRLGRTLPAAVVEAIEERRLLVS